MDSNDSNPDLELIAAFLDDRLSGEERARAVKLMAESDETLELVASVLRQQAEAPEAKVVPITRARGWKQWKVLVPIAAAAALAIVVVPSVVRRGAQPEGAAAYASELTREASFSAGLRPGWDQRWAATRGGEASIEIPGTPAAGSATEARRAFQLGVRSVDLQVALQRGDTALAARLTNEVVDALKGVAFSDLVGASYADVKNRLATDSRDQAIERASSAERELQKLLGANLSASYAFGQWAAAAELAAQTHDAAFFESSRGKSFIRAVGATNGLSPEDAAALRDIDARMKQGLNGPALDEVHNILQTIIRRRGG